jgi:hypothetical protein
MTSRGVRDPERICATLAPGFESPRAAHRVRTDELTAPPIVEGRRME